MSNQNMNSTLSFQFENVPVTVITDRSLEAFEIQDSSYGPVEKGRELTVPRWVANVLISAKAAHPKDPGVNVPDLQKSLWQEAGEPVLQTLPSDFYYLVRKRIEQLALQNKTQPNDIRLAAQNKMEQLLRDLIANRLLKLMKLSLREERLRNIKKKMTEEERWLFDRLVTLLRNWQIQVLEIEISD
jgi:DNA primase